ncbi:phage/plasmid primase, P4 family [Defluviimonas sp. WL0002]|uniref:Phage/plasmid primase, P4 family n=1 Tax=Albidovulum marisflavi TaxID=2984159 RepID=A0ABT2ZHY1_9RHOB|nr:DNA primase family protein [Defluviimonas sp. WL0002]MCV2870648.1 phage/plasmid primase, P4 family [Defluviimonas sp. WL0002]
MTAGPDDVRRLMDGAEEIDADLSGGMDMPPPPDQPEGAPPGPEADCVGMPLNDLGNGQRFVRHFGEDLLFVPRVGWHVWTGTHWQRDDDKIAVRAKAHGLSERIAKEIHHMQPTDRERAILARAEAAEDTIERVEAIARGERSEEDHKALRDARAVIERRSEILKDRKTAVARRLTHAKNAGNSNAINNFTGEAEVMLARALEDLDARPMDVNCLSGVLRFHVSDMREEGASKMAEVEVIPHARDHLITKIMPVEYDPAATCPDFDAFMEEIQPIAEQRRFLQRWFGLSMTAIQIQQFAFFYGMGANGKSVLVDLIMRILGTYGAGAKIESLTGANRRGGGDATPDLMLLVGARGVKASEPEEGTRFQEALIKELTGGEKFLARALHADFIEFTPHFKLTISGNHRPEIHGGDDGIWRRVMLVDFPVQIPAERRRPKAEMDEMLWRERAGIFRWMVEGLLDYLEGGLQVPAAVLAATQEYREDSDLLGAFLERCCVVTGEHADMLPARDLVQAFNFWLEDQGKGSWRPTTVSKRLADKARRWKSPVTQRSFEPHKASTMSYRGIRFNDIFGPRFRDAPRDAKGNVLHGARAMGDDE